MLCRLLRRHYLKIIGVINKQKIIIYSDYLFKRPIIGHF